MPKNFRALMKSQTSGGRSRHSQLIFQSSSMAQSSSTGPWRKACSSGVSVAGAKASNFDQSGLPAKRSASHQTSPASSASRSVSDMAGSTPCAQEKIGLVMKSRRKLMAMSSWSGVAAPPGGPRSLKSRLNLAGKRGIHVILRVQGKAKLIRLITARLVNSSEKHKRKRYLLQCGLIRPRHLEQGFGADFEIVALAAGADDRVRQRGLVDTVLDEGLVDVDGDDLAERKPGLRLAAVGALQLNDLRQLAFEGDRAFRDPGHVDQPARRRGQSGDAEFADVVGDVRRSGIHLLRQVHGGEIPDEFFRLLDILDAVLPGSRGKADDRRMVAKAVKETVGREIDIALGVTRRNPADRARGDDGVEGIVPEAMAVFRLVEVQVFRS